MGEQRTVAINTLGEELGNARFVTRDAGPDGAPDVGVGSDARILCRAPDPRPQRWRVPCRGGCIVPGAPPPATPRVDRERMGTVGEQPKSEILPAHGARACGIARASGHVEPV